MADEALAPVYRMTVDLNVLDHLGLNLYSNIAAVLTEAVANAWDADAETVDIGRSGWRMDRDRRRRHRHVGRRHERQVPARRLPAA